MHGTMSLKFINEYIWLVIWHGVGCYNTLHANES